MSDQYGSDLGPTPHDSRQRASSAEEVRNIIAGLWAQRNICLSRTGQEPTALALHGTCLDVLAAHWEIARGAVDVEIRDASSRVGMLPVRVFGIPLVVIR